jgi:hypothetical protein
VAGMGVPFLTYELVAEGVTASDGCPANVTVLRPSFMQTAHAVKLRLQDVKKITSLTRDIGLQPVFLTYREFFFSHFGFLPYTP